MYSSSMSSFIKSTKSAVKVHAMSNKTEMETRGLIARSTLSQTNWNSPQTQSSRFPRNQKSDLNLRKTGSFIGGKDLDQISSQPSVSQRIDSIDAKIQDFEPISRDFVFIENSD
jgi:hypothetical protein